MHQRDGGVSSAEGIFAPASSASAPGKSAAPGGCGRARHSQRLSARIRSSERAEWWRCWGCDWLDRISSPECNVWEHFRLIIQPIERLGQDALRLWIMSHSVDITNAVDYKSSYDRLITTVSIARRSHFRIRTRQRRIIHDYHVREQPPRVRHSHQTSHISS
jgi:hypothetical protein